MGNWCRQAWLISTTSAAERCEMSRTCERSATRRFGVSWFEILRALDLCCLACPASLARLAVEFSPLRIAFQPDAEVL